MAREWTLRACVVRGAVSLLVVAGAMASAEIASAAAVSRGPYIQLVTHSSGLVVWQNTPAQTVALEYGTTLGYGNVVTLSAGTEHAVPLTGLQPDTRYYYRVLLDGQVAAAGPDYFVQTAPLAGAGASYEFLLWGDSGQGDDGQRDVAAVMNAQNPDFALHLGDIVYPSGQRELYDARYFSPYAPLLRRTPVWAAIGNHDSDRQAFNDFWYLPTNPLDGSELFYSFEYGDIFFVALNTNTGPSDAVLAWMDRELHNSTHRWKVVFFHHPLYSCGDHHGSSPSKIARLGPIFEANGVDLVLYAHDHHYERSFPMHAGVPVHADQDPNYVNPEVPIYVVSGGGGGERGVVGDCDHSARALAIAHFTRVRIDGGLLTLEAIDINGRIADRMTLLKSDVRDVIDQFAPAGGERFEPGSLHEIRWASTGDVSGVQIDLSRNGASGPWERIVDSTPNDGLYLWQVPEGPSDSCVVRVSDATDTSPTDQNVLPFVITAAPEQPQVGFSVRVNFQPKKVVPPAGWGMDAGEFYNPTTGWGWNGPVEMYSRGRNPDVRLDTYAEVPNKSVAIWQLRVPSGNYVVDVVVGDPLWNGMHRIDVEGVRVVNDVSTSAGHHAVRDVPVLVSDGMLTVHVGGARSTSKKTKLCSIEVRAADGGSSVPVGNAAPSVEARALPAEGAAPLNVALSAIAVDPDGDAVQAVWDFGDGTSGRGLTVAHKYTAPGTYTAEVAAFDRYGARSNATATIVVREWTPPTTPSAPDSTPADAEPPAPAAQNQPGTLVLRVNFQPGSVAAPDGYLPDTGNRFDTATGLGWEARQSTEVRARGGELTHRTHVYVNNSKDAEWRAALPNGDYTLMLVAGDPSGSGEHRVRVQGVLAMDRVRTSDDFFTLAAHPFRVTDGFLRLMVGGIAGSSRKTKLCLLEVKTAAPGSATPPATDPVAKSYRVNFQPDDADIPDGYSGDFGQAFSSSRGYGWSPSVSTRERSSPRDVRLATFVRVDNKNTATWKHVLPNGEYLVTLAVGDPGGRGTHRVVVEGTVAADNVKTSSTNHTVKELRVTVRDGTLDVVAGGIKNNTEQTHLCYIDIVPARAKAELPAPEPESQSPFAVRLVPNPANPSTSVQLSLPHAAELSVDVFDVRGRRVRQLHSGRANAGHIVLNWDGRDEQAQGSSSGLYFVRVSVDGETTVHKLALVR